MRASEQLVDDLADAILDGTPIDWAAAESSAEGAVRPLVRHLRVLAAVAAFARTEHERASASLDEAERSRADLHCRTPPIASTLSVGPGSLPERQGGDAPEQWGHLRLVERIGRGAFGEVYRAWDTRLDREVALKLLPAGRSSGDRAASAIIHEGRLLARVRHPNVVTIYGAEQIGDQIGLWMEFVQRPHPRASHRPTKDLQRSRSCRYRSGALSRDVSGARRRAAPPRYQGAQRDACRRWPIVLMDFGTGRELDEDASSDLAGTPLYLAPEVLPGQQATIQSDIYSLGVLLYHLFTGSFPVRRLTIRGVRRAHERGERTAVRTARHGVPRKLVARHRARDQPATRAALSKMPDALASRPYAIT